jgi:hypothetical protein
MPCTTSCIQRHQTAPCPHEIEGLLKEVIDAPKIEQEAKYYGNFDLMADILRLEAQIERSF